MEMMGKNEPNSVTDMQSFNITVLIMPTVLLLLPLP